MLHKESDVVAAACQGDRDAWETLYRRLYPKLRAYMARRIASDHVEDAVSETMTRAVKGIDSYQLGPAGFDGWMFGIAKRVAADHHRKAKRTQRQDGAAAGMADVVEDGLAPGELVVAADDHDEMRTAFSQLSLSDRELLELRVVAGLSVEQVASTLGKRPGAIRTAQSRALGKLRQLLEHHNG